MRASLSCYSWCLLKNTRLYGFTLKRRPVQIIHPISREHWRGNMRLGHDILTGGITLGDQFYSQNDIIETLQQLDLKDPVLFNYIHSFTFLPDLASVTGPESRKRARQLIEHWIYSHHSIASKSWLTSSWSIGILSIRVFVWLSLYDFYAGTADDNFKHLLNTSIAQQLCFLNRHWQNEKNPLYSLWAIKALLLAVELNLINIDMKMFLASLAQLISKQILSDGGHVSRSPVLHWLYVRDLIDIRYSLQQIAMIKYDQVDMETLLNGATEMSMEQIARLMKKKNSSISDLLNVTIQYVHQSIHKMTPILRLLRHVDGKLSFISGGVPGEVLGICSDLNADAIDNVLSVTDAHVTRPPQRAPNFGIERCSNKNSVMLVNTYPYAIEVDTKNAYEEPGLNFLGIEWSVGRHRLLSLADVMIQMPNQKWITNLDMYDLQINVKRSTKDGGHYLEFNVLYNSKEGMMQWQRHIYLTQQSEELRVTDTFNMPIDCLVGFRFQMHPHVDLQREGEKIICTLNVETNQKREIPLRKNLDQMDVSLLRKNSVPYVQNNKLKPQKTVQSMAWMFRAFNADEVLITEAEEKERTILCVREFQKNKPATFKWSYNLLN